MGDIGNTQQLEATDLLIDWVKALRPTRQKKDISETFFPANLLAKYWINQPRTWLAVDSYLLPTSKSRDTKTRTKIKNPTPISLRYFPLI